MVFLRERIEQNKDLFSINSEDLYSGIVMKNEKVIIHCLENLSEETIVKVIQNAIFHNKDDLFLPKLFRIVKRTLFPENKPAYYDFLAKYVKDFADVAIINEDMVGIFNNNILLGDYYNAVRGAFVLALTQNKPYLDIAIISDSAICSIIASFNDAILSNNNKAESTLSSVKLELIKVLSSSNYVNIIEDLNGKLALNGPDVTQSLKDRMSQIQATPEYQEDKGRFIGELLSIAKQIKAHEAEAIKIQNAIEDTKTIESRLKLNISKKLLYTLSIFQDSGDQDLFSCLADYFESIENYRNLVLLHLDYCHFEFSEGKFTKKYLSIVEQMINRKDVELEDAIVEEFYLYLAKYYGKKGKYQEKINVLKIAEEYSSDRWHKLNIADSLLKLKRFDDFDSYLSEIQDSLDIQDIMLLSLLDAYSKDDEALAAFCGIDSEHDNISHILEILEQFEDDSLAKDTFGDMTPIVNRIENILSRQEKQQVELNLEDIFSNNFHYYPPKIIEEDGKDCEDERELEEGEIVFSEKDHDSSSVTSWGASDSAATTPEFYKMRIPSWKVGMTQYAFSPDHKTVYKVQNVPNTYAAIDESILSSLDAIEQKRFISILEFDLKSLPRNSKGINGIKFLHNVIELKLSKSNTRPFTKSNYVNDEGDILVLFDKVGNHALISRLEKGNKNGISKIACDSGTVLDQFAAAAIAGPAPNEVIPASKLDFGKVSSSDMGSTELDMSIVGDVFS